MPIEAMLGLATADHRVDVFGFGMTMYECLIGSVPMAYSARNITASDIHARRPDVSWDLASLIEGCLQRDPAKRTQTMREVVDALAALAPAPSLRPRRSPAPKHVEGRRHPRAPFLTPARLVDDAGNRSDVRVEEISISGAQIVSRELLAQGAKVRVRFALPTGAITECDAIVRWSRKGDRVAVAGVEFQGLGHAETAVIQLYVEGVGRAGQPG
jgi:serine/threonine protein kinase